ncbi:unnamed protein product [Zymoseptoria tritici ST99CH_3D7]|uniref:Rab-GAP TBC domain-containing protein n=1 Tax=Zymoseptoria tritici (strain ST99CH_3D7) TaxID=1276538 RepID=A0A1X7RIR4_ZYMT9|nr:unnamed protein product [Zymoseptoria tritici ST99CH_3D7]
MNSAASTTAAAPRPSVNDDSSTGSPTTTTTTAIPEPHLPLRKASTAYRRRSRQGAVPTPVLVSEQTSSPPHDRQHQNYHLNHHHHHHGQHAQLRGFHPRPTPNFASPHINPIQASSQHAFAAKEQRRPFKPALGVLESQHSSIPYNTSERDDQPPMSPLLPPGYGGSHTSNFSRPKHPQSPAESLRGPQEYQHNNLRGSSNNRLTPEVVSAGPSTPHTAPRESFRSALTTNSSLGPSSSVNTTHTSLSSNADFVKVTREDWEEQSGFTDVDMSVEDAIGMYEDGFESGKGSLDIRSVRSMRSLVSLDPSASQPKLIAPIPTKRSRFDPADESDGAEARSVRSLDRASTQPLQQARPTTPKRLHAAHRRSQSASILILGVPRGHQAFGSRSTNVPALFTPTSRERSSMQIVSGQNLQSRPVSEVIPRDRYGFKKASHYVTVEQYNAWNANYTVHIERRAKKWQTLMRSYGLNTSPGAVRFPPKSDKIKRYVRKGIPPDYRGNAWFWYAGGPGKLAREPGLYGDLLEKVEQGGLGDTDREHIERDLNRTFPDNVRFKPDPSDMFDVQAGAGGGRLTQQFLRDSDTTNGTGRSNANSTRNRMTKDPETPIVQALRRVLQAFAVHNPQIGYCQSLNFIAGLLLLFLNEDEEKAFILLEIVTSLHLPGTHGVALEGANIDIGVLMSCIKDSLPAVWSQLDDQGGMGGVGGGSGPLRLPTVSLATTAWFMSLFVGTLPIECVLRVWDCLFFEGSKTLFRVALSIFKAAEPQILALGDPMEVFQLVQSFPRGMLDANGLMDTCFRRRGGYGSVSQGMIEDRRAERRKVVKEGAAEQHGSALELSSGTFRKLRGRLRSTRGRRIETS